MKRCLGILALSICILLLIGCAAEDTAAETPSPSPLSTVTPALSPSPTPPPTPTPTASPSPTPEPEPEARTAWDAEIPILMYHHIVNDGEATNGMTVTAGQFRADMEWLIARGYSFVLPRDLIYGETLPEKPVMVSFDDGYRSNYELLFPILRELDVKAVIALIVSMPDHHHSTAFLSWEMCREMHDSDLVEFGSHTYNLHNLDNRGGMYTPGGVNGIQRYPDETTNEFSERVLGDLQQSIDALERELGEEVLYFAYPFGAQEEWAYKFIHKNFRMTTLTDSGVSDMNDGFYGLKRYTITMQQHPGYYLH